MQPLLELLKTSLMKIFNTIEMSNIYIYLYQQRLQTLWLYFGEVTGCIFLHFHGLLFSLGSFYQELRMQTWRTREMSYCRFTVH